MCGQRVRKLNPHRMDAGKIRVLRKIADLNHYFVWVKVQQDGRLISPEEAAFTIQIDAVHASRLVWFGLLDRKSPRSGMFRINDNGRAFLRGDLAVPAVILCSEGEVVKQSEKTVTIDDAERTVLTKEYWDNYPAIQVARQ